jgi:SP family arabinose:H+ symporter-like MFS transporter
MQPAIDSYHRGYVYRISAVAALSGLLFGFDTAVINGALPFLRLQFRLTDFQVEMLASALLVGAIAGSIASGWVSDRLGRRRALIGCAIGFAAASIYSAFPRALTDLEAARFIAGIAIGMASALTPVYIAEVAPPMIRGRLVCLNQLAIVSGILIAYLGSWLLARLGPDSWRWMFGVAALPSFAYWAGLIGIPESPRWLASKGDDAGALRVLAKVTTANEAQLEIVEIRRSLIEESGTTVSALFSTALRRPMWLAIVLAFLCQATGINTIIYYGSLLLQEHASRSASSAIAANVLVGAVNFAGTILAMAIIDKVGRRTLLLAGCAGMAVALTVLGFAFSRQHQAYLLMVACILAYVFCFAFSWGAVIWTYMSELFPNALRARAASISTMVVWISTFLVTLTFLSIVHAVGVAGTYWIYAGMSVLSVIFIYFLVPETAGRSLEEIQEYWHPHRERTERITER